MILLVTHPGDGHLPPLRAALRRRGARTALLDLGRLPSRGRLTLRRGGAADALAISAGGRTLRGEEVEAVWWRRPGLPSPDPAIPLPAHREFAAQETAAAVAGALLSLRARWVDHPTRVREAGLKPYPLAAAREAGLAVPRTCITSDPRAARAFLAELGPAGAIFKGLTATPGSWRETRRLGPAERRLLPLLRLAPAILQERVEGEEVRVTAVGGRLFAAAWDGAGDDGRLGLAGARLRPLRLPAGTARALRALLARLGLSFAAVDLRRTPAGELVFLEVNPVGQWRFVEERTGQPITAALAGLLAGR